MKEPKIKHCGNCYYFLSHYAWCNNRFAPIACGHCMNSEVPSKQKRKAPRIYECPNWEPIDKQRKENYQKIKDVLTDMSEKITAFINYFEQES